MKRPEPTNDPKGTAQTVFNRFATCVLLEAAACPDECRFLIKRSVGDKKNDSLMRWKQKSKDSQKG